MPISIENEGSTARDFCMLERNFLSHVKLFLLFFLLSASALLGTRLPDPSQPGSSQEHRRSSSLPIASLHLITSLATIGAGCWEYFTGFKDFKNMRAFLVATRIHPIIMCFVTIVVFATCILFLVYG
ncbi:hypothetical protein SERLA73DRAFT_93304 [Serpula lacrymans var. lacrymans S7.3]|uniref:DUF202 domain-containing protein n=1 Tax=Serpula lacrymans var. lacrymans (strain S7.3) TaxID=936435 RepID=F8Q5A6_SERL3|nr:hypothetical protein SERLA73DRAFT_93304 [Serpula lacrymans var. lacrymans S7.3]